MKRFTLCIILSLQLSILYAATDHTDFNGIWVSTTEPYHQLEIIDYPYSLHVFSILSQSNRDGQNTGIKSHLGNFKGERRSSYTFFNVGKIFLKNGEIQKAALERLTKNKNEIIQFRYGTFKQKFKRVSKVPNRGEQDGLWYYLDNAGYPGAIRLYHRNDTIDGTLGFLCFSAKNRGNVYKGDLFEINTSDNNIYKWNDRQVSKKKGTISINITEEDKISIIYQTEGKEQKVVNLTRTPLKPTFVAPDNLKGKWISNKDATKTIDVSFGAYKVDFKDKRNSLFHEPIYKSYIETTIKDSVDGTLIWRYSNGTIQDPEISSLRIIPDRKNENQVYYKGELFHQK